MIEMNFPMFHDLMTLDNFFFLQAQDWTCLMVGKSLLLLLHVTCGYMFLTAQAAVHVHMYFKNPCFATGVCSRPECTNPTV